ncbi:hypothetical protein EJ04DRAFT_545921 [Polyplosphaeria fusca]|uniref:Peptidase M20 domain-containing protein 2 n=1 Tax=Polyplosphaeria fusca TaxID=682080 RepID=A0A9P4QMJ4_9PLEO|nr:hypothetical protein EJ04DRAFT_545921 [Polyplosphaeria fusca]
MEDDSFIIVAAESQHFDDILELLSNYIAQLRPKLWPLNTYIHTHPELAFKERKAHHALTSFLRSHPQWTVKLSAYGLETAWTATYDSGKAGPVVSFNAEMDALPGLGHACGHNLIASASVAAALATQNVMQKLELPGKIVLLGTPGEEGYGGGKIQLLHAGAYKDVDITLISHPGILNNSPMVRTTAFAKLEVEYFGRAAHAARSPWLGINALDALVTAYNAISVLRQQTMPSDVIGLSITNGGSAPNVIHAYASGVCVVRAETASRLAELQRKVESCFHAGAEATGARLEIKVVPGYADHVPNAVLARSYTKYWNSLPDVPEPPTPADGQFTRVAASTDQGNLSHAMPSVNASFAIPPGPQQGQPHSPDFEVSSGTMEAFDRALRVGKALAGVALDVLRIPGLLEEVQEQWRRDMK